MLLPGVSIPPSASALDQAPLPTPGDPRLATATACAEQELQVLAPDAASLGSQGKLPAETVSLGSL